MVAFIYHDHVSWFPGFGYVVQTLFREHYAETYLASTSGTFRAFDDRSVFFDQISTAKPEDWTPGTVDQIATARADGRIVVKAVNYQGRPNTVLVRLQGDEVPDDATVTVYEVSAALSDAASLEQPDRLDPEESTMAYARDLEIELEPYGVAVVEIRGRWAAVTSASPSWVPGPRSLAVPGLRPGTYELGSRRGSTCPELPPQRRRALRSVA